MSTLYKTDIFDAWMKLVDWCLEGRCGMSHLDLPDCAYWDWWEDGYSPDAAAYKALREADIF